MIFLIIGSSRNDESQNESFHTPHTMTDQVFYLNQVRSDRGSHIKSSKFPLSGSLVTSSAIKKRTNLFIAHLSFSYKTIVKQSDIMNRTFSTMTSNSSRRGKFFHKVKSSELCMISIFVHKNTSCSLSKLLHIMIFLLISI